MRHSEEDYKLFNMFFLQAICIFVFLFPLFFQLSGSIFTQEGMTFDSQGNLLLVPLPIASITCFIGILALIRLEKNHWGGFYFFYVYVDDVEHANIYSNARGGRISKIYTVDTVYIANVWSGTGSFIFRTWNGLFEI